MFRLSDLNGDPRDFRCRRWISITNKTSGQSGKEEDSTAQTGGSVGAVVSMSLVNGVLCCATVDGGNHFNKKEQKNNFLCINDYLEVVYNCLYSIFFFSSLC